MGLGYVILSLVMAVAVTVTLNVASRATLASSQLQTINFGEVLNFMIVPFTAIFGLLISTPTYLLFVNDKNAGVLEYLLAVGMSQRDVFKGYLKAALMLSMVAMGPAVLLHFALSTTAAAQTVLAGGLALATGLSDVALTTFLMTTFSSMQRRPTGMNSPLGISVGIGLLMPEFFLLLILGPSVIWLDLATVGAILGSAVLLYLSVDRLIMREKLLP